MHRVVARIKRNNAYEKYHTKVGYYSGKQLSIGTGFIYFFLFFKRNINKKSIEYELVCIQKV